MRPADEQKEFLEHAQFGEGKQSLTHTKVDRLFWIGPLFMMGFIAAGAVGTVLCICGLVRMQSKS